MNQASQDHVFSHLYPPLEPLQSLHLDVGDGHQLYVEECGNRDGIPVVFLHGGPGGGCSPHHRRLFNPKLWRIILLDQRGCGRSKPLNSLKANTTWHLVADLELIREHFAIDKWAVFGGSWGSTLALAYAQSHPKRVSALFLRGIFLFREKELEWFYQGGAGKIFPEAFQTFVAPVKHVKPEHYVKTYYELLTGSDHLKRMSAAKAWSGWEGKTATLVPDPKHIAETEADDFAVTMASIECHYMMHRGWFARDEQLLLDCHKIKDIPGVIVHGRYDVICPAENALDLHRAWPKATLNIVDAAGHSLFELGIARALRNFTDEFTKLLA